MDYQQAWTFLDNLQFFKIKLGLDAMDTFLGRVDNPQHNLPCVHIGGTNGKGSVGATLLSILTEAGYTVGLYTSPHLSSVRERFRIGNCFIPEQDFARLATKIADVLGQDQITYFEFTTTMALLWFAEQKVDLALMEVGMGGRLDATNVIAPLVAVITNVSRDHEQYLGNTLAEVAGEKAGIIKPGIPVVSGAADDVSRQVIVDRCKKLNSPLYLLDKDFSGERAENHWTYTGLDHRSQTSLPMTMKGGYQVGNASLALAALELLQKHHIQVTNQQIRAGLSRTRWPGRLEKFCVSTSQTGARPSTKDNSRSFLLDGAHNPAGVKALQLALEQEFSYKRLILVWGAMSDKDISTTLETIAPMADRILFTRPESERSAMPEDLMNCLPETMIDRAESVASVEKALQAAAEWATEDDLICIAGSLYLVGRARQILLGELV
ncbi:MAG: bifunctional folylpolyglutamate synthase/dihydrofolate synthase [Desulfobulbaceae bacterium]|nr:bifunctional folylpolyglutamate synthase/dihydrofolate synthase [Desulfobulbaceae bacterium]